MSSLIFKDDTIDNRSRLLLRTINQKMRLPANNKTKLILPTKFL